MAHRETPISEITLRRYEKPYSGNKRELLKKTCLSLGLLQPGDSRDVIVDIFYILLEAKKELNAEEIVKNVVQLRKNESLENVGTAASNIRRQMRRLRAMQLVEKVKNKYRIMENMKLTEIFDEKIQGILLKTISARVREYLEKVEREF
jgi:hypothetical protein